MSTPTPIEVPCSAGCKRVAVLPDDGSPPSGWECLPITGRWRCAQCWRELTAASGFAGVPAGFLPDSLAPESIGGLKKLPEAVPLREGVK